MEINFTGNSNLTENKDTYSKEGNIIKEANLNNLYFDETNLFSNFSNQSFLNFSFPLKSGINSKNDSLIHTKNNSIDSNLSEMQKSINKKTKIHKQKNRTQKNRKQKNRKQKLRVNS